MRHSVATSARHLVGVLVLVILILFLSATLLEHLIPRRSVHGWTIIQETSWMHLSAVERNKHELPRHDLVRRETPSSESIQPQARQQSIPLPPPSPTTTPNLHRRRQTPITVSATGVYTYLYCAIEPFYTSPNYTTRALTSNSTTTSSMSISYCSTFCAPHRYFGVEFADQCYCGDVLEPGTGMDPYGDDSNCNSVCSGNSSEYCGGSGHLGLYELASAAAASASSTASSTVTVPASASATSAASISSASSASQTTSGKGGLSHDTIIAIAVPVAVVGSLIIAGLIFLLVRRTHRRNKARNSTEEEDLTNIGTPVTGRSASAGYDETKGMLESPTAVELHGVEVSELHGGRPAELHGAVAYPVELAGDAQPVELDVLEYSQREPLLSPFGDTATVPITPKP